MSQRSIFFISCLITTTQCYRILFIPAHGAPSHAKSMYPAAEALHRAGHEVHVVQLVLDQSDAAYSKNIGVTDHIILYQQEEEEKTAEVAVDKARRDVLDVVSKLCWQRPFLPALSFIFPWKMTTDVCVRILSQNESRQQFYSVIDQHWDAVIVDNFFASCGLMAIQNHILPKGALVVDFSTTILLRYSSVAHGAEPPLSTTADFIIPYYDYKRFAYRFGVLLDHLQYVIASKLLEFLIPYWGRDVGLAGVRTRVLAEESALAVTCVANGLDFSQPRARNVMDLDSECPSTAAGSLSSPFKEFIEDPASDGTILIAMGHFANWKYAPDGALDSFVQAFARLPQYRIIWQYDISTAPKPNLTDNSKNVMLAAWIPQIAILNHPKTKLFVSHMGLKSMREGVCAKVPLLAMPMFAEQYRNTAIAQYRGFGMFLDKLNLTRESVYASLKRVLDDDGNGYARAVRRLQAQLSDRIRNASDYFSYQVDYLIRRNNNENKRVIDNYVEAKWRSLPSLTKYAQADLVAPVLASMVVLICLVR